MRYGILADIHGNIWALEAVLEDARYRHVDRFINLGDLLYGPLKPRATFERLQTIDAVTIQGNQERDIYAASPADIATKPTCAYVIGDLGHEPIAWLRALTKTALVDGEIFACHGSPDSDMVFLLEDVTRGMPFVKPESAILKDLHGINAPVVLCAHSHIPRVVKLSSGTLIVNPGSLGLPAYDEDKPNYYTMQNYSSFASYAVLEKRSDRWYVEQIRVPYDDASAARQAERQGRSDWAYWLTTGRVAPQE